MSENGNRPDEESMAEDFEEMEVTEAFGRMVQIADELQQHADPEIRQRAFELLDWVEAVHREAIVRVVATVPGDVLESLRRDPVVAQLFSLYIEDEEPEDLDSILEDALDEIRPYVHSHGGEMEVLGVDTGMGIVKLRLMGSCHGCPSSSLTLTQGVEKILRDRWSGFRKLEVEGEEEGDGEPKKLLQIQTLRKG